MKVIRTGGLLTAIVLSAATGGFFATSQAEQSATPTSFAPVATGEVVRDVLASTEVESAPGEVLALAEYTIPAGAVLPIHTHPGVQMATVQSGALTYHVIENGSVIITRADGTGETGDPGETLTFEVGDSWIEPEGMVHYAENLTSGPTVLMSTSLLEADLPASEIVNIATPAS